MYLAKYNDSIISIDDMKDYMKGNIVCPLCGENLIAKRGKKNAHHFSHKLDSNCDSWYNSEEYNYKLQWLSRFPNSDIETVCDDGKNKHRADVRFGDKIIFQFYNKSISAYDWEQRITFYKKFVDNLVVFVDCREKDITSWGYSSLIPFYKQFKWKRYNRSMTSPKDSDYTLFLQIEDNKLLLINTNNEESDDWSRFTAKGILTKDEAISYCRKLFVGQDGLDIISTSNYMNYMARSYIRKYVNEEISKEIGYNKSLTYIKDCLINNKSVEDVKETLAKELRDYQLLHLDAITDKSGNANQSKFSTLKTDVINIDLNNNRILADLYKCLPVFSENIKFIKLLKLLEQSDYRAVGDLLAGR